MRAELLERYVAQTIADMYEQTGIKPGGKTNKCHFVVLGAATGARLNFNDNIDPIEQRIREERLGLYREQVLLSGTITAFQALQGLLTLFGDMVFDKVLVSGTMQDSPKSHILMIVKDDDTPGALHVVDSQLPGATTTQTNPADIVTYVKRKLRQDGVSLAVARNMPESVQPGRGVKFCPTPVAEGVVINTRVYTQV